MEKNNINKSAGESSFSPLDNAYNYEKTQVDKLVFIFCYSFCFLVAAAAISAMIYVIVA